MTGFQVRSRILESSCMLWGAARRVDALCRKRFGRNGRGKLGVGWDVWGTFENVFFETKISL